MDSVNVPWFFTMGVPTFGNLRVSLFAANRSLSQLVTSFFGSWCQGIHLMLLFAWTSFSRSITFVAMIDPWFSFFRIAWVSWTFGYLYSLVKRFASLHFFLALFRILPPFGEIVSHFRAYLTLFGKTNKMCCFLFVLKYLFVFYSKHQFLHWFSLFDCQRSVFAYISVSWSVWMDSNHRPRAYQARALTTWATDRFELIWYPIRLHICDIAWFDSVFVCLPSRDAFQTRSEPFPSMPPALAGGGDEGNRTLDPLLAGQVLSQLSYTPI